MSKPRIIGFDVGGVLLHVGGGNLEALLRGEYTSIPVLPGALDTVRAVIGRGATVKVISVSGGNSTTERHVTACLRHHGFIADGMVQEEDLHFTETPMGKGALCGRLGITQMVDDDEVVVTAVRQAGVKCIWFGSAGIKSFPAGWCPDHAALAYYELGREPTGGF